jgi:hypothetical protein
VAVGISLGRLFGEGTVTDPLLDALDRRFGSSGPVRVYDPKRTKIREAPQPPREFVLPFRSPPALETKFIGHVPKRDKKPRANAGAAAHRFCDRYDAEKGLDTGSGD